MQTTAVSKPNHKTLLFSESKVQTSRLAAISVSTANGNEDAIAAGMGDREAFERLYREHMPRIFTLVARMVGDRVKAEDIVQDVFVRAWRKLPTFRGESTVYTWLHRIAVNVVLSHRRTESISKERYAEEDILDSLPARLAPAGVRFDLENAIAALPQGARHVFVLYDIEGHTHDEIGNLLGITAGGSKAQLHRARMLLREALNR